MYVSIHTHIYIYVCTVYIYIHTLSLSLTYVFTCIQTRTAPKHGMRAMKPKTGRSEPQIPQRVRASKLGNPLQACNVAGLLGISTGIP